MGRRLRWLRWATGLAAPIFYVPAWLLGVLAACLAHVGRSIEDWAYPSFAKKMRKMGGEVVFPLLPVDSEADVRIEALMRRQPTRLMGGPLPEKDVPARLESSSKKTNQNEDLETNSPDASRER